MNDNKNLINPIIFSEPEEFIPVDQWVPNEEDKVFKTTKGIIMTDVSSFYGCPENLNLNAFVVSSKRAYSSPKMRDHTTHYLNYFEKFYDRDHELLMIYCKLKYLIDCEPSYTKDAFFYDLNRYILHGNIAIKVGFMNRDNYCLTLSYKNKRNNIELFPDVETQQKTPLELLGNPKALMPQQNSIRINVKEMKIRKKFRDRSMKKF